MSRKTLVEVLQKEADSVELEKETLQKELESAKEDYPELVRAHTILALYAKQLEVESRITSRIVSDRVAQFIREIDWFEFLANAAMDEFLAGDPEEYPQVRRCPIIKQDYDAAIRCVKRLIDQLPQTESEWDEYHGCLDDLKRHAAEMEANNCK